MLRGHVGCVAQVEEEGVSLPVEADLDEISIVATFAEQDAGPYSDGVRCQFLELLFDSDSVSRFFCSLKVSFDVFAV